MDHFFFPIFNWYVNDIIIMHSTDEVMINSQLEKFKRNNSPLNFSHNFNFQ